MAASLPGGSDRRSQSQSQGQAAPPAPTALCRHRHRHTEEALVLREATVLGELPVTATAAPAATPVLHWGEHPPPPLLSPFAPLSSGQRRAPVPPPSHAIHPFLRLSGARTGAALGARYGDMSAALQELLSDGTVRPRIGHFMAWGGNTQAPEGSEGGRAEEGVDGEHVGRRRRVVTGQRGQVTSPRSPS